MWMKLLLGTLLVAGVIETLWPVLGFGAPDFLLTQFGMQVNADSRFLAFVLAWCLLFVALVCWYAFYLVRKGERAGVQLSLILGLWWVGIGLGLFLGYGRVDNLFLDGLKGAVLALAAWKVQRANDGSASS